MKHGMRYSLAVYVGLLFAGFLHQPNGRAYLTDSMSQVSRMQTMSHETATQTWAKPHDCESEAVRTAETARLQERQTPAGHQEHLNHLAQAPKRNPFR